MYTHIDKTQKNFFLGKYMRRWRRLIHYLQMVYLSAELQKKPKEIVHEVEVIREVPVVQTVEIVREVPVIQTVEIVKEVEITNKRTIMKNAFMHSEKLQFQYFLAKYCRRWRNLFQRLSIIELSIQLNAKPREIIHEVEVPVTVERRVEVEVVKEVTNKKSITKSVITHIDRLKRWYLIGKFIRKWRKAVNYMIINQLSLELSNRPNEIVKEVEIIKEIPVVRTEVKETIVEVPIIKETIIEVPVVKEIFREVFNRSFSMKHTISHIDRSKRWYVLSTFFKKWRSVVYHLTIHMLILQLEEKPREIVREVIKEVIKEVPVVQKERQIIRDGTQSSNVLRGFFSHTDKLWRWFWIGRAFRKWRRISYLTAVELRNSRITDSAANIHTSTEEIYSGLGRSGISYYQETGPDSSTNVIKKSVIRKHEEEVNERPSHGYSYGRNAFQTIVDKVEENDGYGSNNRTVYGETIYDERPEVNKKTVLKTSTNYDTQYDDNYSSNNSYFSSGAGKIFQRLEENERGSNSGMYVTNETRRTYIEEDKPEVIKKSVIRAENRYTGDSQQQEQYSQSSSYGYGRSAFQQMNERIEGQGQDNYNSNVTTTYIRAGEYDSPRDVVKRSVLKVEHDVQPEVTTNGYIIGKSPNRVVTRDGVSSTQYDSNQRVTRVEGGEQYVTRVERLTAEPVETVTRTRITLNEDGTRRDSRIASPGEYVTYSEQDRRGSRNVSGGEQVYSTGERYVSSNVSSAGASTKQIAYYDYDENTKNYVLKYK
jgi:hypothetical protein